MYSLRYITLITIVICVIEYYILYTTVPYPPPYPAALRGKKVYSTLYVSLESYNALHLMDKTTTMVNFNLGRVSSA